MKYLLLVTLLSSCALLEPIERGGKPTPATQTEKLESCLYRLIEKNGVEAKKAETVCLAVFRRQ